MANKMGIYMHGNNYFFKEEGLQRKIPTRNYKMKYLPQLFISKR